MFRMENEVFDIISKYLNLTYPNMLIYNEYTRIPASFPCVYIEQADTSTVESTSTSNNPENHSYLLFEIEVYSAKKIGKKSEVKAIFEKINEKMLELGFVRMSLQPMPNFDDISLYRMVGRYTAIASQDNTVYRR